MREQPGRIRAASLPRESNSMSEMMMAQEEVIRQTRSSNRKRGLAAGNSIQPESSSMKANLIILAIIGLLAVLGVAAFVLRFVFSTLASLTGIVLPPWTFTTLFVLLSAIAVMFPSATGRTVTALLARRAGFLSLKMEKLDVWNLKAEEVCVESPSLGTIRLHSVTVRPDYKQRFLRLEFSGVRVELNKLSVRKPAKRRKPPFSALAILQFVRFVQIDVDAIEVSLRGTTCRIRDLTTIVRLGDKPSNNSTTNNKQDNMLHLLLVHSSLGMLTVTVNEDESQGQTQGGLMNNSRGTNPLSTNTGDRLSSEADDLFAESKTSSYSSTNSSSNTSSSSRKQTPLRISTTRQPPLLELTRLTFWFHMNSTLTSADLTETNKNSSEDDDTEEIRAISGATLSLGSVKLSASALTMLNVLKFVNSQQQQQPQPPVSASSASGEKDTQKGIRQAFKTVFSNSADNKKAAQSMSSKVHPLKQLVHLLGRFRADPFVLSIASVSGDWYDSKGVALHTGFAVDVEVHSSGLRLALANPVVNIAGATGDATTSSNTPALTMDSFVCEVMMSAHATTTAKTSCGCITSGLRMQLKPTDLVGLERSHIEFLRLIRSSLKLKEKSHQMTTTSPSTTDAMMNDDTPLLVNEIEIAATNGIQLKLFSDVETDVQVFIATLAGQLSLQREDKLMMMNGSLRVEETSLLSGEDRLFRLERLSIQHTSERPFGVVAVTNKRDLDIEVVKLHTEVAAGPGIRMYRLWRRFAPRISHWKDSSVALKAVTEAEIGYNSISGSSSSLLLASGTNGGGVASRLQRRSTLGVSTSDRLPLSPMMGIADATQSVSVKVECSHMEMNVYLGYEKGVRIKVPSSVVVATTTQPEGARLYASSPSSSSMNSNPQSSSMQLRDLTVSGFDETISQVNTYMEVDHIAITPAELVCTGLRTIVTSKTGPFPGELMTAYFSQRKAVTLAIKEVQEDIPISHSVAPTSVKAGGDGTAASHSLQHPNGPDASHHPPPTPAGSSTGSILDTDNHMDSFIDRFPFRVSLKDISLELEDDEEPDDVKYASRGFFEHHRRRPVDMAAIKSLSPASALKRRPPVSSQDPQQQPPPTQFSFSSSSPRKNIVRISVTELETSFNVMTAWRSKAGPASDASLLKRVPPKAQRTRAYLLRSLARVDASACPAHRLERALVHGMGDLVGLEFKSCLFGASSLMLSDYPLPIARFDSLNLCARSLESPVAKIIFADLRPVPCSTRHVQVVLGEVKPPSEVESPSRSPSPASLQHPFLRQKSVSSRSILEAMEGGAGSGSGSGNSGMWTKKRAITISSTSSFIPMKAYYEIPYAVCANLQFVWGECLNPALVAMDRALLRLLPGASDSASPKMGWWDKTRYMMHGKLGIHVTSGFEVKWLTGNSPYVVDDTVVLQSSEVLVMDSSFENLASPHDSSTPQPLTQPQQQSTHHHHDGQGGIETPPPIIGIDIRVWEMTFTDWTIRISRHEVEDGRSYRFMTCPRLKLLLSLAWRCRSGGDHYVQLQHGDADDPAQVPDQFAHFRSQSLDMGLDFEVKRMIGNDYSARDRYPSMEFCWRVVYPMLCSSFRGMVPPVPPNPTPHPTLGKCLTRVAFNVRADRAHILWWEDRSANLAFLLRGTTVDSRVVFTKDVQQQQSKWTHDAVLSQFVAVEAYVLSRCKKFTGEEGFGDEFGLGESGYAYGIGFPHEPFYCAPAMRLTLGRWRMLETVVEEEDDDDDAATISFHESEHGDWFQTASSSSRQHSPHPHHPIEQGDSNSAYKVQIDEVRLHWTLQVRDEVFRFFGTVAYLIRKEDRVHYELAMKFNEDHKAEQIASRKDRVRKMDLHYLWNRPRSSTGTTVAQTTPAQTQSSFFDRFPEMSSKMAQFLLGRYTVPSSPAPVFEDRWSETSVEVSRDRPPACSTAQVSADGLKSTWEEACREYTIELRWPQVSLSSGRSAVVLTSKSATIRDFRLGLLDLNDVDFHSLLLRKEIDVEVKETQMFATVIGENAQPGTRFVKSQRPDTEGYCLDDAIEERNVTFLTARGSVRRGTTNHNFTDRVLFLISQARNGGGEKDERAIIQEQRQKRIGSMFIDMCSFHDQDPSLDRVGWTEGFQVTDVVYTDTTGGAKVPSSHLGLKLAKSFASIKSRDFFAVLVIVRDLLLVGPPPDVRELAILASQEATNEMKRRWRTNHPGLAAQQPEEKTTTTSTKQKSSAAAASVTSTPLATTTTQSLSEVDLKVLKAHVERVCATRRSSKRLTLGSQRIVYELAECDWKLAEPLSAFQQQQQQELNNHLASSAAAGGGPAGGGGGASIANNATAVQQQGGHLNPPTSMSAIAAMAPSSSTLATGTSTIASSSSTGGTTGSSVLLGSSDSVERVRVQVFQMRGDHMFGLDGSTKVEFEVGDLKVFDLLQNQQIVESQLMDLHLNKGQTQTTTTNRTPFLRADAITSSPIIAMGCRVTVYELLQVHLFPGSHYKFKLKVSSPVATFIKKYLVEDDDSVPLVSPTEEDEPVMDDVVGGVSGRSGGGGGGSNRSGKASSSSSSRMMMRMDSAPAGSTTALVSNPSKQQQQQRVVEGRQSMTTTAGDSLVPLKSLSSNPNFDGTSVISSSSSGGGNRMKKRISKAVRGIFGTSHSTSSASTSMTPRSMHRMEEEGSDRLVTRMDRGESDDLNGTAGDPQQQAQQQEEEEELLDREDEPMMEPDGDDKHTHEESSSVVIRSSRPLPPPPPSPSAAASASFQTSQTKSSSTAVTIRSGVVTRLSVPKSLQVHPEPTVQPWNSTAKRRNVIQLVAKRNSADLVLEIHRNEMGMRLKVAPRATIKLSDIYLVRRSQDPYAPPQAIDVYYTTVPNSTSASDSFVTVGGEGVFTWSADEPGWQGRDAALPWVAAMAPGLKRNVIDMELQKELVGTSLESILRRTAGVIKRQLVVLHSSVNEVGGRRMTGGLEHLLTTNDYLHHLQPNPQQQLTEEDESDTSSPPAPPKSPRSPTAATSIAAAAAATTTTTIASSGAVVLQSSAAAGILTKEESQQQPPQQQLIDLAFFKYARIGQIQLELTLQGFAFINNLQRNAFCTATVYHRQLWTWYRAFKSVQRFETRKLLASAVRGGIGGNFALMEDEAPLPPPAPVLMIQQQPPSTTHQQLLARHSESRESLEKEPTSGIGESGGGLAAMESSSTLSTYATSAIASVAPQQSTSTTGSSVASWFKKRSTLLGTAAVGGSKKSSLSAASGSSSDVLRRSMSVIGGGGEGDLNDPNQSSLLSPQHGTATSGGEGDSAKYDLLFGLKQNKFGA